MLLLYKRQLFCNEYNEVVPDKDSDDEEEDTSVKIAK